MPRYSLRTLLILLAVGPAVLAGSYWAWSTYEATRWRWYKIDSGGPVYLPPNTPGYHWEKNRPHYDGWHEAPNKKSVL